MNRNKNEEFVIKSTTQIDELKQSIKDGAIEQYKVEKENNLGNVLSEIIKQSKIEFNYEDITDLI